MANPVIQQLQPTYHQTSQVVFVIQGSGFVGSSGNPSLIGVSLRSKIPAFDVWTVVEAVVVNQNLIRVTADLGPYIQPPPSSGQKLDIPTLADLTITVTNNDGSNASSGPIPQNAFYDT
jgi:hypothetical protein